MRFIDPELVQQAIQLLPDNWEAKALIAHDEVAILPDDQRKKAINSRGAIWRDLKATLSNVSQGKCWYCESKQVRSDDAVDHFPLWDETKRAKCPTDDWEEEQPLLLDPCCPDDPALLWFNDEGYPTPNPELCGNTPSDSEEPSYAYKRVTISIKHYHLDHIDLVERRKELYAQIRREVKLADKWAVKAANGDTTARQSFQAMLLKLKKYLSQKEEYSSAAYALLMGLRGTSYAAKLVLMSP